MKKTPKLTQERLHEVLSYDGVSGAFKWVVSRGKASVGKSAGKLRDSGRVIGIDGENYPAARLAWFWVHGEWPKRLLRFKDGNRDNTSVENLTFGESDFTTQAGKNAYAKKWRSTNPRSQRHLVLRRSFGMELSEYQEMFAAQDGKCAVCKCHETVMQKGERQWLSVDHDHNDDTKGGIRGLLCASCNFMLGNSKDKPDILRAGAAYLEAHAAKPKTNVIPLAGRRVANEKGS